MYTISIPLSPTPSNLGRQPCWVTYLLVCVYGKYRPDQPYLARPYPPLCLISYLLYVSMAWPQAPLRFKFILTYSYTIVEAYPDGAAT